MRVSLVTSAARARIHGAKIPKSNKERDGTRGVGLENERERGL